MGRKRTRLARLGFGRDEVRGRAAEILPDSMHAKRVASIGDAVVGSLEAASLSVSAIGAGLALNDGLNPKHAVKQVDRLLSNTRFDLQEVFPSWAEFLVGDRKEVVVAMDWTEFDADDHSMLCISVVTKHGRATPLVWKTVRKSELAGQRNNHEDDLVGHLRRLIPAEVHIILLADRGFGDQHFYSLLSELGMSFVVRFRQAITVTDSKGTSKPAIEWLPSSGRARMLKNVSVTMDKGPLPAVVVVQDKAMADPWCLATNIQEGGARRVINLYGRRFKIEETFRDAKDPRYGLGLSQTRVKDPIRRDRLFFVAALAFALVTLLGAAGERVGLDRMLKVNTVKRRTHSLFRQGSYWVRALPNLPEERWQLLMSAYDEILREHRFFRDTFGLV